MSAAEPYSAQSVYAQIPWRPSERAVWIVWRYAELADTTELAVAMAIASFVDDLGHGWAPNIEIIGKLARRKSTAVSAAIGRLQQCGFMTVEDRTTKGEAN